MVCLLLKDGSEYSFIHRSIQEYFYSSFISNKSPIAKEKFYTKLMQEDSFYIKLRNIVGFLEKSDSYSYNKFFKLLIINNYIDVFNITNSSNTLLDSFYVQRKGESRLEFVIVKQGMFNCQASSMPNAFQDLFRTIHENLINKYNHMLFGLADNIENMEECYVKIKNFNDEYLTKLIEEEVLLLGKRLIENKKETIEAIRKRDGIEFDL